MLSKKDCRDRRLRWQCRSWLDYTKTRSWCDAGIYEPGGERVEPSKLLRLGIVGNWGLKGLTLRLTAEWDFFYGQRSRGYVYTPGISLGCKHSFVSSSRKQNKSLESTFKSWRKDSHLYSDVLVITVNVHCSSSEHVCVLHMCDRNHFKTFTGGV